MLPARLLPALSRLFIGGLVFALCWSSWGAAAQDTGSGDAQAEEQPLSTLDPKLFPLPGELEPNVRFWTDVFTRYNSHQLVLHDEEYLEVVYAVLDFTQLETSQRPDAERRRMRQKAIRDAEQKYRLILQRLARGEEPHDPGTERRVEALFDHIPGGRSKFVAAAQRFRTQRGLSDVFEQAIGRSGRYLPAMEEAFARRGLPKALTRMAFVESMFQEGARSKVGAGGMWQIMPATGRSYLSIGHEVDERFDPLMAAEAAAQILQENYQSLKTWPLAVTAYNYGANGLRRAVRKFGTRDPAVIFAQHRTRTFGFASRNFYAEFLAAATVYELRQHYFPGVHPAPRLRFDEFRPDSYVSAVELADRSGIDLDDLKKLNPALSSEVWREDLLIPKDYRLRLPVGTGGKVSGVYAALPASSKSSRQAGYRYRVRRGDTLSAIAARYGTNVRALQRANGLRSAHSIRIGQVLLIPGSRPYRSSAARAAQASVSEPTVHVVQRGETLSAIAERYGTSTSAITANNGLRSSHRIYPGQRLQIPAGSGPRRHVVQPGETLGEIARIYGTSVSALKRANHIRSHIIHPLQTLIIP
ncbi:MAG: LysM peptidoglycan-binding domain-containing protein [Acidobacteriota bacterium]|nr:LysM peptidoglycan-binding domain-containing protein [Acidobacteriota bacterium]